MNNKMIGQCAYCGQDYCQECTDDGCTWQTFCSNRCEKDANEEARLITANLQRQTALRKQKEKP